MQVKGYESKVAVRLLGPDDLTGASLVSQIRERACAGALLGELSTDDGTIELVSDAVSGAEEGYEYETTVTLTFPDTMTGAFPDEVVTDIARVDSTPDAHFGFILKIPFTQPVTRIE